MRFFARHALCGPDSPVGMLWISEIDYTARVDWEGGLRLDVHEKAMKEAVRVFEGQIAGGGAEAGGIAELIRDAPDLKAVFVTR